MILKVAFTLPGNPSVDQLSNRIKIYLHKLEYKSYLNESYCFYGNTLP